MTIATEDLRTRLDVILRVASATDLHQVRARAIGEPMRQTTVSASPEDRARLVEWAQSATPDLRLLVVEVATGACFTLHVVNDASLQRARSLLGRLTEDAVHVRGAKGSHALLLRHELLPTDAASALRAAPVGRDLSLHLGVRVHLWARDQHVAWLTPGSGRVLTVGELEELAADIREPGFARMRLAFVRARVPHEVPVHVAQRTIAELIHSHVFDLNFDVLVIAVTPGATKSTTALDYVRVSPSVRLVYLAPSHDVAVDMYRRLAPHRATARLAGILTFTDEDGGILCTRAEMAQRILDAGGSPGAILCPACPSAPRNGGDCPAYGGREGADVPDALITVHHLVSVTEREVVKAICDGEERPTLAVIDEPPSIARTQIISLGEVTEALEVTEVERRHQLTPGERRKRYQVDATPHVSEPLATLATPALELVERMLQRSAATPPATRLRDAAVDLIRASDLVDQPGAVPGARTTWLLSIERAGEQVPWVYGDCDWDSLDPTPWIQASQRALQWAVEQGRGVTKRVGDVLAGEGGRVAAALSAISIVRLIRLLASWLAPSHGSRPAVVRDVPGGIAITHWTESLLAEVALTGAKCVVLDATPDRAGLRAIAGPRLRWCQIDVQDGAPISRTLLYSSSSGRKKVTPGGSLNWEAFGPLLVRAIEHLEQKQAKSVLLVTYKKAADPLRKIIHMESPAIAKIGHLGARKAVARFTLAGGRITVAHFGDVRGKNEFKRGTGTERVSWLELDAVVTIGDPFPDIDELAVTSELLGLSEAETQRRPTELAAAELAQAHGRLRPPVRSRPGVMLHIGRVVPLGWHRGNADEPRRVPSGRPAMASAMSLDELRRLVAHAGGQRALAVSAAVHESSLSRWLSGERPVPADAAERMRAAGAELAASRPVLTARPPARPHAWCDEHPILRDWRIRCVALGAEHPQRRVERTTGLERLASGAA